MDLSSSSHMTCFGSEMEESCQKTALKEPDTEDQLLKGQETVSFRYYKGCKSVLGYFCLLKSLILEVFLTFWAIIYAYILFALNSLNGVKLRAHLVLLLRNGFLNISHCSGFHILHVWGI